MTTEHGDTNQSPPEWVSRVIETCEQLPHAFTRLHDARVTHTKLMAYQEHLERKGSRGRCEESEICHDDTDNFLRGEILDSTRTERIHRSDRIALSYWRHGESCACRASKSEEFVDELHPRSAYTEQLNCAPTYEGHVTQPGMGLEMDCFTSFLANSTKEQYLHDYLLQSSLSSRRFFKQTKSHDDMSDEELIKRLDRGLESTRVSLTHLAKRRTPITSEMSEVLLEHLDSLRRLANQLHVMDNCDVDSGEEEGVLVSMEQMQSEWNKYLT